MDTRKLSRKSLVNHRRIVSSTDKQTSHKKKGRWHLLGKGRIVLFGRWRIFVNRKTPDPNSRVYRSDKNQNHYKGALQSKPDARTDVSTSTYGEDNTLLFSVREFAPPWHFVSWCLCTIWLKRLRCLVRRLPGLFSGPTSYVNHQKSDPNNKAQLVQNRCVVWIRPESTGRRDTRSWGWKRSHLTMFRSGSVHRSSL